MLRRKLLLILGPLVALLALTAILAIWLLQNVLSRMDHINNQAWVTVAQSSGLGMTISKVELDLYQIQEGRKRHLDVLLDTCEELRRQVGQLGEQYLVREPECRPMYERMRQRQADFEKRVSLLATAQDPEMALRYNQDAIGAAMSLRQELLQIARHAISHAQDEQRSLATWFRGLVLGLAVVFLVVINVSAVVLLRLAAMILKPIDALVEASRRLAEERFEHRVELRQDDEFDELARAYNQLAEQLQANERRKIEMMGQVALTLNHELNNAISIIELQLRLLGRQAGGNAAFEKSLRQIHEGLGRMTRTVEALKHVRRIVLTDYIEGLKMLDLERSVQEPSEAGPAAPAQDAAVPPPASLPASKS